jgi:hypothetical protein
MRDARRLPYVPDVPPRQRTRGRGGECRPIDVLVGRQLRSRRLELGLSHEDLGVAVDLPPMRIAAYERGNERILPAHLVRFSELLEVRLHFFFVGA